MFENKIGGGNVDVITALTRDDTFELDSSVFKALRDGALSDKAFYEGDAAHDANDRIIYNAKTGALFYDADGTGSKEAIQFATINQGGKFLSGDDFQIV